MSAKLAMVLVLFTGMAAGQAIDRSQLRVDGTSSFTVADAKGLIAICATEGDSFDGLPVDCQLSEGRTLTELVRVWVTQSKYTNKRTLQMQVDSAKQIKKLEAAYGAVIAAQKKQIAILTNGLTQVQKDLKR